MKPIEKPQCGELAYTLPSHKAVANAHWDHGAKARPAVLPSPKAQRNDALRVSPHSQQAKYGGLVQGPTGWELLHLAHVEGTARPHGVISLSTNASSKKFCSNKVPASDDAHCFFKPFNAMVTWPLHHCIKRQFKTQARLTYSH